MSWVLYALGAAVFWSLNIVFDKYVVDHEIEDPVVTTIFCSISAFILIGAASLWKGAEFSALTPFHLSLGFLYTLALIAYYSGMGREDVSRFAPTLAVDTIFILFLSVVFLDISFTTPVYLGVFAVVSGAFLISLDDPVHSLKDFQSKKGAYLAIAAAFVFGTRDVMFEISLIDASYWTVLLGTAVGGLVSVLLLGAWKRRKLIDSSDKGSEHLLFIGVLMSLGYLSFIAAINTGPVSLASAVVKSQNLIIFGITLLIHRIRPETIEEKMSREIAVQKLAATLLIVAGLVTIQVF